MLLTFTITLTILVLAKLKDCHLEALKMRWRLYDILSLVEYLETDSLEEQQLIVNNYYSTFLSTTTDRLLSLLSLLHLADFRPEIVIMYCLF